MLKYPSCLLLTLFILHSAVYIGCGYHLKSKDGYKEITSIAIPLMTSTSTEKGFEADFTGIIRNEFIGHSTVPILPKDEAQTVLIGHIHEVRREPASFRREPYVVSESRSYYETTNAVFLKVKLDVRLMDRTTGKTIWQEKAMEERARYNVGTDPLTDRFNRQQALLKIAGTLAKRIYLKTMERF